MNESIEKALETALVDTLRELEDGVLRNGLEVDEVRAFADTSWITSDKGIELQLRDGSGRRAVVLLTLQVARLDTGFDVDDAADTVPDEDEDDEPKPWATPEEMARHSYWH